jgi:hypothetical protein
MIEENGKEIQTENKSFSVKIGHNSIETFKLILKKQESQIFDFQIILTKYLRKDEQ